MKSIFLSLLICVVSVCHADFTDHLKKNIGKKSNASPIRNIDFIYLINLDQRPEKFEKCLAQLKPFELSPHRFSAIYGWDLPAEAFNELGIKFLPGMLSDQWVAYFPPEGSGAPEVDFLRKESVGKVFFSRWMTPGTIGCTLSHLSVLQDAYDAGYQTIWIMEDDISVQSDPNLLSDLIDNLDELVGKKGWDILYTDIDLADKPLYTEENDFESDLKGDLWWFWRPDVDLSNRTPFAKRTIISDDFIKIGSRMRTHSMIIRRAGMKKILSYAKEHHLFLPYDHELAIIPNIQLFNLRYNIVTCCLSPSDTQTCQFSKKNPWEKYKQDTLSKLPQILGWQNPQKAEKIMEFIREEKPMTCVEIGAFGGAITYPIARTLHFIKQGVVYAIDAWDSEASIEGVEGEKIIKWLKNLDMKTTQSRFQDLFSGTALEKYCRPVHQRSKDAITLFKDQSIDFLYMDGNTSQKGSLEDARLYFPKVKNGGYIWLNDADSFTKNQAVAFLMKNCDWIKEKSFGINCILFRKK